MICSRCHCVRQANHFVIQDRTYKTCNKCRVYKSKATYMCEYRRKTGLKDKRDRKDYQRQYRLEKKLANKKP